MMDYTVATAPTHEPVSLAETKRHLRVTDSDNDTTIKTMIAAARRWCEEYQHRTYCYQTLTVKADNVANLMKLPAPPLLGVDSIVYTDTNGSSQTISSTIYDVDTTSLPGRITLAYNQAWPSDVRGDHHCVTITAKVGYAATFTATPAADTLTVSGHHFEVNDFVHVYTSAADLPDGLTVATDYYVTSVSGAAIQLATTEGGTAVTISDAGTGTHYIDAIPRDVKHAILMLVADLYDQRRSFVEGQALAVPYGVKDLLAAGRMFNV